MNELGTSPAIQIIEKTYVENYTSPTYSSNGINVRVSTGIIVICNNSMNPGYTNADSLRGYKIRIIIEIGKDYTTDNRIGLHQTMLKWNPKSLLTRTQKIAYIHIKKRRYSKQNIQIKSTLNDIRCAHVNINT